MPEAPRILVVEDEPAQRRLVVGLLAEAGYQTAEAGSAEEARRVLAAGGCDLVLSDWKLPGDDGLALLETVRGEHPDTAFVMVTAYGTIAHAVESVRRGADDYLAKPFERQTLLLSLERTLRARRLEEENRRLSEALGERERLVELVGSSPSMQRLYSRVEKLAGTRATVLLTGESGTGKELTARALHALSGRARGPFVAVNCAAIPEGLLEAEFFGAERGAYTGSDRSRPGRFEAADGGTLFLDEVGELPLALQPKLLRVLQERRFVRVGDVRERAVDVRLLAATNRVLSEEVAAGRFREDLFYRLDVVPIRLPPLRERREDVPLLVEHFRERATRRHGLGGVRIPHAVLRRLLDHGWPGNVRELANVVERLLLLAEDGVAREEDLPDSFRRAASGAGGFELPAEGLSWPEHERSLLAQALARAEGNRARAAGLLGLGYKAFLYRLEKYGLG